MKNICWGSASASPSQGWLRGLKFNQPEEPTAYGLKLAADAPKPFLMCLQVEFDSYRNNQRNVIFFFRQSFWSIFFSQRQRWRRTRIQDHTCKFYEWYMYKWYFIRTLILPGCQKSGGNSISKDDNNITQAGLKYQILIFLRI